ncbi:c-type cytochrome [Pontibacter virosus]|uniref:Quinol:cytochrome c oxidoreductase monoheme cytochrome subunit n=1 Tax=Pontibacter virosus TaxID=1765052 RepID=A0A2U1AZ96_9BACT|nr:cytochrome c [Pontibacter virosus]PVY41661.1 quinol:cytochrome c oxidoreductase monoheme cytochrome subunit [Pontibacter virosus]
MKGLLNLGFKASAILFSGAMLVACSNEKDPGLEFAPDMYHSIPLDPYSQVKENLYNPGGMNMREPAQGTVARGKMGYNMYLSKDEAEVAGVELKNPLEKNELNLAEGQVLYTRFCAPCHGDQGDGQGLVGQKFKGVPSYSAGRVATLPEGHIYHVIANGRGRMLPHGSQVNPTERWKIVMYVQQLQGGEVPAPAADEAENTEDSGTTPTN